MHFTPIHAEIARRTPAALAGLCFGGDKNVIGRTIELDRRDFISMRTA
ncbi:MAG TPA: hypothetical protein VK993_16715 [Chthoniobacterales bacterium]|nr:hypothetical protein [Chthoniobacterales bacterium]